MGANDAWWENDPIVQKKSAQWWENDPVVTEKAAPSNLNVAINAANKGLAAIPDALLNTPANIINLAKITAGIPMAAIGRPDLAPEITQAPNLVSRGMKALGFIKDQYDPQTEGQRIADALIQGAVGGAVMPSNALSGMARNALLGSVGSGAGYGVQSATGNEALGISANIAAPMGAATAAARLRAPKPYTPPQTDPILTQTAREVMEAGYKLPPSTIPGAGLLPRMAEGLSGKAKTDQFFGIANQEVTTQLAKKSLGLPESAQLTSEAAQKVRAEAYQAGYVPVTKIGVISTDKQFIADIDRITANRRTAAESFPERVKDVVTPAMEALKVGQFDAAGALKMSQLLRDEANVAFRAEGKSSELGRANKAAAKAIEDQIERALTAQGQNGAELLAGFREARKQMAKAHTVEDAIREGSGIPDALAIARRYQAGQPLSGELETIGKMANVFRNVSRVPQSGHANPFTVVDFGAAGIPMLAGGGPAGLALPLARVAARYGILSDVAQKAMRPNAPKQWQEPGQPPLALEEGPYITGGFAPKEFQSRNMLSLADDVPQTRNALAMPSVEYPFPQKITAHDIETQIAAVKQETAKLNSIIKDSNASAEAIAAAKRDKKALEAYSGWVKKELIKRDADTKLYEGGNKLRAKIGENKPSNKLAMPVIDYP